MKPLASRALGYQIGLIGFTTVANFVRLPHYLLLVHPRYLPRALLVVCTTLLSAPLRLWERVRFGRRICAVQVEPPVFVIGHWRSGTTHLHNLLTRDTQFGYLSMYQAMVPGCSLVAEKWLRPLLSRVVPAKRPMDNMTWPIDAPQEDEIPLAKVTTYSLYLRFLFPRKTAQLFKNCVLLDGASARVAREIKRKYYRLLQVATLHAGGRRLVLKNPVNTARVRLLLEMFPDAKFVHIHRSPYDVFVSTRHMHASLLPITTVQSLASPNASADAILGLYAAMMHRLFEDRALIPQGNLVELRFEALERDPVAEVHRIYTMLGLDGFDAAKPALEAYVASQQAYTKNRLPLSRGDRALVEQHWGFALDELGYPPLPAGQPPLSADSTVMA